MEGSQRRLLTKNAKFKLHENTVASVFQELDMKYEKETGIQALPVAKSAEVEKKLKQETEEGAPEEIGAPVSTYTGKRRGRPKKLRTEEE